MRKYLNTVNAAMCGGALLALGMFSNPSATHAQSAVFPDEATVQKGLDISPVTINLSGKDRGKVGWGSYLVNATSGCNDCHSNPSYADGGDPFKGQPKKFNTKGFLAGGQAFGPFLSRNITPDGTGEVAGGLSNFKTILRTGADLSKLHPELGPLLQVMPWPVMGNMTDREIEAIYAYLQSIPCVEGGPGQPANRCATVARTSAIAGPKAATVVTRQYQLDGSQSTSVDGKPLTYFWTIPQGAPSAGISQGTTATPVVQFGTIRGTYTFQLTVTDSKGTSATDTVTVNFAGY
jgi:hypothetical protein